MAALPCGKLYLLKFFSSINYTKHSMVMPMEDNSGKKFSLQDWVMKRAANQSGVVVPPISSRQDVSARVEEDEEARIETRFEIHEESRFEIRDTHPLVTPVEQTLANIKAEIAQEEESLDVAMKAVSNGSAIKSALAPASKLAEMPVEKPAEKPQEKLQEKSFDKPLDPAIAQRREEIKEEIKEALLSSLSGVPASAPAPSVVAPINAQMNGQGTPLQQMQVVRLLTDLGDRLRQSEKEREVLWKELDICRKQIADMGHREDKSEKTYTTLETQMNQREVFVKELVEKQIGLEQKLQEQLDAMERSKAEQTKMVDKLASVETATGSAIVRVEDAIAENTKLTKRVEQLSQDKARLMHKLEVVEETLAQTQDTLRAKALVLLTDQAVASRTNLPQTPAWTGDDTVKVAQAMKNPSATVQPSGPVADLAASLKPKKPRSFGLRPSTAALLGLIILGVAGGILFSRYWKSDIAPPANKLEVIQGLLQKDNGNMAPADEDKMMQDAAKLANEIEPESIPDDAAAIAAEPMNGALPSEDFAPAQMATEKAVEEFKAQTPRTSADDRLARDKALPESIRAIEVKALRGDANAQHDLAAIYTAGQAGTKVNYGLAAKWFEEAAHNGVANAQYNLGVLYHQGLGVKKETAKAMQMYRVAANSGHPEAQYNLGIAYVEGVGVEYNPQIAAIYFEEAASGGIVEAAYNLGLLHENGLMGESQPDEAVFWYTLATNKGSQDAAQSLSALKTKLDMSDVEAEKVVQKTAEAKPKFLEANGKAALPAQIKAVTNPVAQTDVKPVVKAEGKASEGAAKLDPVIVSQIQEQLIRLGLYKGAPNGDMSPVVAQAIKTYQQDNRLKVDGQPSDDLLVQMLASGVESAAGN